MMNPLYVGIDVSLKNHKVCFMKPDGTRLQTFSIPNSPTGSDHLANKVQTTLDKLGINEVILGMEATSHYGEHLFKALRMRFLPVMGKNFWLLILDRLKSTERAITISPRMTRWMLL